MSEFTGERVVPGQVDQDLFNEHASRYRFAREIAKQFTGVPRVLDAGCGTGYGAAGFAAALVTAVDISGDALRHAREHFPRTFVQYAQTSCEALPFADNTFDLVCAFEVIEHLERWPLLLSESRRVLKSTGVLLVSTPNKAFYEEARGTAGPNPFHCHEFEYAEFEEALSAVFPHVRLWSQNHASAIVFAPVKPETTELDAEGDSAPWNAHFFLAACSENELASDHVYAWLPSTANLLRERERHIAKLEGELAEKNQWLEKRAREHAALQESNQRTQADLEESNGWAFRLQQKLKETEDRVTTLQDEATERLAWVHQLDRQIVGAREEIAHLNAHREQMETDLRTRAAWGFALDAELKAVNESLAALHTSNQQLADRIAGLLEERRLAADSKWMRLGRRLNVGPQLE